ncbi:SMC-Scp complex subunit ScpB [Candidatus Woesearchaeota archaeon]|nr:SMC-Scp complex subunit ScpB [Candidatus Woesearchaeota archaeon]
MSEEANKVEALLFSSGRKMSEEELSRLTGIKPEQLKQALEELKRKHEGEGSPLILLNEGENWKLMTKEKYLSLIQNIVTETELDKSLMETLAVIAWKYPILQADVIKLRNNKAYDHLRELEEAGFIAREKHGRTRTIKLTPKFFEYFDLPPSKAHTKEAFKEIVPEEIREGIEKTESDIEDTEKEIEERKKQKEEIEKKMREEKEKRKKQEVDLVDDVTMKVTKLDTYEQKPEIKKEEKQKLGIMDVYGEAEAAKEGSRISETEAEKRAREIEKEEITPEVEAEMEKMLHPGAEPKKEKPKEVSEEEKELMPGEAEETPGEKEAKKILEEDTEESEEEKKKTEEE